MVLKYISVHAEVPVLQTLLVHLCQDPLTLCHPANPVLTGAAEPIVQHLSNAMQSFHKQR